MRASHVSGTTSPWWNTKNPGNGTRRLRCWNIGNPVPVQYFGTAIKERQTHWPKGQVMANLLSGSHCVTDRRVRPLGPASC
jgi:hypothetical protein